MKEIFARMLTVGVSAAIALLPMAQAVQSTSIDPSNIPSDIPVEMPTDVVAAEPARTTTAVHMPAAVDGKAWDMPAYNIDGNNYVKLRDLAYVLKDSERGFSVDWDATARVVALSTQSKYQPIGGEMVHGTVGAVPYLPSTVDIAINGTVLPLESFNIAGSNYIKLRDLAQAFDFSLIWDEELRGIAIDSTKRYEE